jgi:Tfp pilus assembly protein PilP
VSRRRPLLTLLGAAVATAACGSSPSPPPKASAPLAAAPAASAPQPPVPGPARAESAAPTYDAKGRRDPFQSLDVVEGTPRPVATTAKLTGIVKTAGVPWALVETPDGVGYILRVGDALGDSRVMEIGPDTVVFGVAAQPGSGVNRVVLKLSGD